MEKLQLKHIDEEWRDVVGYEGYYQISNTGRVRSVDRIETTKRGWTRLRKGSIRKPRINIMGYLNVALSKENIKKNCLLHRIIAQAFIPNPENKPQIDHINTIRNDNRIENLRWVTPRENARNPITKTRYRNPNLGKRLSDSCLAKKIDQYDLNMKYITTFGSAKEAAIQLNCSGSNITNCLKGKIRKTHNYIFKYHEQ